MTRPANASTRFTLPASRRLRRQRDFARLYNARCSVSDRHLIVYAVANGVGHPRLGLAVGKRFGNAVRRNRFKRLLREAFRLEQHAMPADFDYVLIPRLGPPAELADYRQSVRNLAADAARKWQARQDRAAEGEPS